MAKYVKTEDGYKTPEKLNLMNQVDPVGTGSFSLNREANTAIGQNSVAIGGSTIASGDCSHAEGHRTKASNYHSHAEGYYTTASGYSSHAEGGSTIASGEYSHAEGWGSTASGNRSHAEGYYTTASSDYQHVQGKYNIVDTNSKYAYIIGNGTSGNPHNCFMIDWNGAIYVQASDNATKMMKITVASDGTITATQATV